MSIFDDLPLIVLNCYLLWNYNEIHENWSYALSICLSCLLLGWHFSHITALKEAKLVVAKINAKIEEAHQKRRAIPALPVDAGTEKMESLFYSSMPSLVIDDIRHKSSPLEGPQVPYAVQKESNASLPEKAFPNPQSQGTLLQKRELPTRTLEDDEVEMAVVHTPVNIPDNSNQFNAPSPPPPLLRDKSPDQKTIEDFGTTRTDRTRLKSSQSGQPRTERSSINGATKTKIMQHIPKRDAS